MSEAISKAKLLERLQREIGNSIECKPLNPEYNGGIIALCSILKTETESGTFDLSPTDVDRVYKDCPLCGRWDCECEDIVSTKDYADLLTKLAETEAEVEKWEKEARLQYRLHNEMIEESRKYREKLNQVVEALEKVLRKLENPYPGTMVECHKTLSKALQSIKGETP